MAEVNNTAQTKKGSKQPSAFEEIRSTVKAIQTGDFRTSSNRERAMERSESRRKKAEQREKAKLERIQSIPTEIDAKDPSLLSNQVKHARTYWNYSIVLGNQFIRNATTLAMEHLDDIYNFLDYNVPALIKNKAKIRAVQVQLGSRLKDLREYKDQQKDSVYALFKSYGLKLQDLLADENLQRITPPMQVKFTISSPHSIELLKLCAEIDNILTMEDYLVMFGYMQPGVQIRDARALSNAIQNYSRAVSATYEGFNKKLVEVGLRRTRAQRRDIALENEIHDAASRDDNSTDDKTVESQSTQDTPAQIQKSSPRANNQPRRANRQSQATHTQGQRKQASVEQSGAEKTVAKAAPAPQTEQPAAEPQPTQRRRSPSKPRATTSTRRKTPAQKTE
ncbi:MAG: hypothetical protein SPL31_06190 [Succinivibrio sp.]|nr:hypothetical protein [Succinivibrio sp.]